METSPLIPPAITGVEPLQSNPMPDTAQTGSDIQPADRKPLFLALAVGLSVFLTILIIGLWWFYRQSQRTIPLTLDLTGDPATEITETSLTTSTAPTPSISSAKSVISTQPTDKTELSKSSLEPTIAETQTTPAKSPDPTAENQAPPPPTGPGVYACDPEGDCRLYEDKIRTEKCTTTFADSACLKACNDTSKRCTY